MVAFLCRCRILDFQELSGDIYQQTMKKNPTLGTEQMKNLEHLWQALAFRGSCPALIYDMLQQCSPSRNVTSAKLIWILFQQKTKDALVFRFENGKCSFFSLHCDLCALLCFLIPKRILGNYCTSPCPGIKANRLGKCCRWHFIPLPGRAAFKLNMFLRCNLSLQCLGGKKNRQGGVGAVWDSTDPAANHPRLGLL